MQRRALTETELSAHHPGELTLATVTLIFTVVILAVVAFKIFTSKGSKISLPGGYKFEFSGNGK